MRYIPPVERFIDVLSLVGGIAIGASAVVLAVCLAAGFVIRIIRERQIASWVAAPGPRDRPHRVLARGGTPSTNACACYEAEALPPRASSRIEKSLRSIFCGT